MSEPLHGRRFQTDAQPCAALGAQSFTDAAIENLAIAVCRCSSSKLVMKLHKRERSTSTHLQRERASRQRHLKTGTKDQTQINLPDCLSAFNTRLKLGFHRSDTAKRSAVQIFTRIKLLPAVTRVLRSIFRGIIRLLLLKRRVFTR